MTASLTLIYELLDPRDRRPHYVGKTRIKPFTTAVRRTHPLTARLKQHLAHSHVTTPLSAWIIGLRSLRLRPAISKLDLVIPPRRWADEEKFWISLFIAQGFPILNVRAGGGAGSNIAQTFTRAELDALAVGERIRLDAGSQK